MTPGTAAIEIIGYSSVFIMILLSFVFCFVFSPEDVDLFEEKMDNLLDNRLLSWKHLEELHCPSSSSCDYDGFGDPY